MVGSHLVIAAAGLVLLAPWQPPFPHMNVIRKLSAAFVAFTRDVLFGRHSRVISVVNRSLIYARAGSWLKSFVVPMQSHYIGANLLGTAGYFYSLVVALRFDRNGSRWKGGCLRKVRPRKDATHDVSAWTDPSTSRDDQDDTEDETQLSSSNARRLKEFCLSDAECSHTNKQARCVDSLCGCQTDFYASADGSLCMPRASEHFAWKTCATASKHGQFKSISSAGSRLRQLSLSGSQRIRFLTFQWDWTRLEEDVSRSDELRNAVEQEASSAAYFAGVERERSGPFHWTTFNVTGAPVQHSRSSVRDILLKESARTLKEDKSAHRLVVKSNYQAGRPQTMPRTRISTLSTRTLMPSRAGPRNTMTPQATKANDTPRVYRNALLTQMNEAPDEESATCSNNLQRFFPSPAGGSFAFTKGELCEETPRKYKSEVVRQPSPKQNRRAASEGLDPQDASVKEERTRSSCRFQLSTAPGRWSSGQDSDYSLWTTVSWATTNEIEDAERTNAWGSIVSSSQPIWPCEQVAWKLADRKARTCETFTVQDDFRPVTLKSPGKIAIAHPSAEVSQFIDSRWPPAQDRNALAQARSFF
ncbi:hypothetical protein HPB51_018763 [Rhipicephalus microplus]|uniref:Uncharacterized protein n=1 Tax=Rhipicephalus microplus TaxID=6941 RepID=A0A9J6DIP3_RHIMP|nr:hypothetical protein HPB51_018763 [Rhipicephalus microplus]